MSGVGLQHHKARVHEAHHVADGVERAQGHLTRSVVVKHRHLVRYIQIMIDGVGVALKLAFQVSVDRQTSCNVFDKVGHLPVLLVLPGRSRAPMAVEAFLNHAHLFVHSLLGIFLHARVEGGVNLQTIGIEVYVHLFLVEEIAQVLGQLLSEVQRLAVVNVLYTKTQLNGHGAERVVFSLRKMSVGAQVVEHHVAALQAALRVQLGVVG